MTTTSRPPITRVLATVDWSEKHRRGLAELFAPAEVRFAKRSERGEVLRELERVEVAVIKGTIDEAYLKAPRLRWVHCDQSGLDSFAPPHLFDTGLMVTSSAGRSGPVLAEHALFFMLALCYRFPLQYRAQRLRVWGTPGQEATRGLYGRSICIVGIGGTGTELARMCLALNMDVTVYRRRALPSPVPGVRLFSKDAGDHVGDALDGAEFLALCASLNDESYHLIGREEIARMRRGGFIVNVARAQLVDMDAMADALRSGQLGGAGSDVLDPDEPLSPFHRAWSLPNMLITPHVTPQMPDRAARTLEIVTENHRRYLAGEPLINQLTRRDAFTPRARGRGPGGLGERAYRYLARLFLR